MSCVCMCVIVCIRVGVSVCPCVGRCGEQESASVGVNAQAIWLQVQHYIYQPYNNPVITLK